MGRRMKNLTGEKFGRLTVLEFKYRKGNGYYWLCKCECGNGKVVQRSNLISGQVQSCGCLCSERLREYYFSKAQKMVGRKFGKLVVKDFYFTPGLCRFICGCDCGNTMHTVGTSLRGGGTTSCGCKRQEVLKNRYAKMSVVGQRFGRLVAEERIVERGKTFYRCMCDCGNEKLVAYSSLQQGKTRSCGCLRSETLCKLWESYAVGKKFGRLVALKRIRKGNTTYYKCKCDCGNEKLIAYSALRQGGTRSCGCLLAESRQKWATLHVGQRFGLLVARDRVRKDDVTFYRCECDCGNEKLVRLDHLRSGNTRSCGCLPRGRKRINKEV